MIKAIYIDAAARDVREITLPDNQNDRLTELQRLVGGYVESAWRTDADDVLWVDEEGMFKAQHAFFRFAPRGDYPLAGNGVMVGRERLDRHGDLIGQDDPSWTVDQVRQAVSFVDRAHVDAWTKGNASEPAILFYELDKDLKPVSADVIARVGRLFGDMPKPLAFICPQCSAVSYNPKDVEYRYCVVCHEFFPKTENGA
jgi:hypothetical protein